MKIIINVDVMQERDDGLINAFDYIDYIEIRNNN